MFTIFHLFRLLVTVSGFNLGIGIGHRFGIGGEVIGGLVGVYLGIIVGRIPDRIVRWLVLRSFGNETTPQLWDHLRDESYLMPNWALLELKRRGEPLEEGLNLILSLLISDDRSTRIRGFVAFSSAFSEHAESLRGYSPDESEFKRHEIVSNFKRSLNREETIEATIS